MLQFQQIEDRINHANIDQQKWFNRSDLFNSSCFYSQSDEVGEYLSELKDNINKLIKVHDTEYVEFISERVTQQFSCLKNLVNSQSVNRKAKDYRRSHNQRLAQVKKLTKTVNQSSQDLYSELSKLQEFERRLLDMVAEKQHQLSTYSGAKLRNDYQQQVLVTQQRLGRCRQAISKVEEQIQKLDDKT